MSKGERFIDKIIKKASEYADKDFVRFSTIVTVVFTSILWAIKSLWYAFCSGRFSVYNIDNCYINSNNDSILLQLGKAAIIIILCATSRYLYYRISMGQDVSKFAWKRKVKKVVFLILEMVTLFLFIVMKEYINIIELFKAMNAKYFWAMFWCLGFICFMMNLLGIDYTRTKKQKLKQKKEIENVNDEEFKWEYKDSLRVIIVFVFAIGLVAIPTYVSGSMKENSRTAYKVIICEAKEESQSKYCFLDEDKDVNIYPIVYENEECYILSRIFKEEGKVKIDYDYQQIVPKENQETYMMSDIYKINIE